MSKRLLLIFTLICTTGCKRYPHYSVENLYAVLDRTSEYFETLRNGVVSVAFARSSSKLPRFTHTKLSALLAHESPNASASNVDGEIAEYMEATTKAIVQRQRRSRREDLQPSEEVNVLQGFEEASVVNLPDFQDIAFVSVQDEQRLLWLAAAIDSTKILLYQLLDNTTHLLATYPQADGKRIIANNYGADVLTIVQTSTDEIVILRLGRGKSGAYEFQFKQEFEIPGVVHMSMWYGMNQLYLGIASDAKVLFYTWLGEHFDKIDTLPFGARKLLFFRHKSFMHVIAVGSLTRTFRFSVRSNRFVETQRLHDTRSACLFHFKEGHFEERFLALADDDSTILYKEMYNRFVPFQRIASARYVRSLTTNDTVVLLAVTQEGSARFYQYDGWRFVELSRTKLSSARTMRRIHSYSGDTLVVQDQDGEWKFLRPIWDAKKTPQTLRDEVEALCSEVKRKASRRNLEKIADLKSPVKVPNAYIGQLRARNINDHNATELIRLTEQYRKTISMLNLVNNTLIEGTSKSKYTVLHGKKVTVRCRTKCHVHRLNTDTKIKLVDTDINPAGEFGKFKTADRTLKFANLRVKAINNWKCPVPNVAIDDIFVKGSVNGMSMENLQEGTLKIFGDQEVSGEHLFENLYATNISIPLNIATQDTIVQMLRITEARAKEFNLVEDEFFLPLNGPAVTMTGSITAAKVKVTGLVELRGQIAGKSAKKLMPLTDIYTPLNLSYNCYLQNVTFSNFVKAQDIVSPSRSSLKRILENSVPLDSDVPKHVMLISDKIQWDNVTILEYKNWVTKNSTDAIIISGAKRASNNVVLTNATYENLPTPKLTVPVCTIEVVAQDITSSSMTVNDLIVNNLHVPNVTGARDLSDTMFDSVPALQSVDFSTKLFTGKVVVKNISASEIKGVDVRELKSQASKWIDVDRIRGPVNVPKLLVHELQKPINFPLPATVNTVIILGKSNIGMINGVNISSFIDNVQYVNDTMSLEHVTLVNGFVSNHTYASRSTLNLSHLDAHPNLHSKRISSTLETSAINVPQTFGYVASNVSSTFVIQGTARFAKEPTVRKIKEVDLQKLSEDLWMSDQGTVISGSNMSLRSMTVKEKIIITHPANTLNINMWLDLSEKLLSKTKRQNITVAASFRNVAVPAVVAANDSALRITDPNWENLLANSLMKNKAEAQIVDATWHFEELNISNLAWNGRFNDIDLNTEIVRFDAAENIITGRKTIANLLTTDLRSHDRKFAKFAKYALTKKCRDITAIRGRKTFTDISLNNLSVKGNLTGRSIEQALLKRGKQTIFGAKRIHGHLNVSSLIADGTVNDVLLTQLMDDQVKEHELAQTIETEIGFRKDFEVFGNITIGGLYEGTNLDNISDSGKLDAALGRTTEVAELTRNVTTGLRNSANYVSKFEEVNEDTADAATDPDTEDTMPLNSTCVCESKDLSKLCNDTRLLNALALKNSSAFTMTRLALLGDTVFVVIVSSDFVSVYTYAAAEENLRQRAGLHLPDIIEASVEPADHALWIALRLPRQTLVLRYQAWNEFEQYVLPASDTLVTSKTPNNQHLLIRSDGVWNLGGVLHPEHMCKLPLNGEIKAFAIGTDYYVKMTKKNSTTLLKARYVGSGSAAGN